MRCTHGMLMAALALGCGGSDGGDGGTGPGGTPASVSVSASASGAMAAIGDTRTLTATVRDASQRDIPGASVTWTNGDGQVVTLSNTSGRTITATAAGNGTSRVTARSGTASGTIDLVVATGGPFPSAAAVTAQASNAFNPARVDIAAGGTVSWTFQALHNVTFSSATGAPSNIPSTDTGTQDRTFAQAGTFDYHCTIHAGMSGQVVVH